MAEGFRGELGEQGVHGQQEGDTQDGTACGGEPSNHAHFLRLINGGDKQGPHAGGDHDPGGKAQQEAMERGGGVGPQ